MKVDPRFLADGGREIFTGNELLVKGALEVEGGVHLLTGYPGSPIAAFFDTLESIGPLLAEHGVAAKIANNEALGIAMVNGAQMAGCRAIATIKSVGLHVAADALALGVLAGTQGDSGALIVIGDDPWSDSTQVPADSRFLAEHLRLPVVEPSNPQEVKDWVGLSFKLGRSAHIFIGYIVTVASADGGGTVDCSANHFPQLNEKNRKSLSYERDILPNLEQSVLLPPRTWRREVGLQDQFQVLKAEARRLGINRTLHAPQKGEVVPMGFVASGVAYSYLAHALTELGLTGRLPILKLGMSYPVDEQIVVEFARQCGQLVVVEERRSFVERQIVEILNPLKQTGQLSTEVYGKRLPRDLPGFPETRGLNPSIVIERIVPLLQQHPTLPVELTNGRLSAELDRIAQTATFRVQIPDRTPTFCPGCPHRDSSGVLLELRRDLLDPEYMLRVHKRPPVDLVSHGDTGCYTMLMFEPNAPLMQNYSGMGLGGGTGSGIDPFIDNKQLVFMGDGTFFHSGQTAISHSIYNGQDITYIILDNKTTAMTGHQCNPGNEHDLAGRPTFAQDIERIVTGMIPKVMARDARIVRIDPEDRPRYRKLLEQTILADGVKIVIADKECGITYHRRRRAEELKTERALSYVPRKTYMNVDVDVCEYCLECTNQTGCPGLTIEDTDYGPKVQTSMSSCVNDGACQRIHACPAFEQVTVIRKQPKRAADECVDLAGIPDSPRPLHADQQTWRCYLAGVGGMGIGLCTAILSTAGHEMGYHVQFLDKKGLAIRNGGVYSQIVFSRMQGDEAAAPLPHSRGESRSESRADSAGAQRPGLAGNGGFTTATIPYGKADLLLGVDLLEATRAIDPKHPYRVASPDMTCAVVNTAKTPTILTLMGRDDFDPSDLEQTLRTYTRDECYFGFNVGDLCERLLDSKLYANIMMLGIAFQQGYLPLTREALETAIRTVVRHETERNIRAFNIGRKIVVRPDQFVVEMKHDIESAPQAPRRKLNVIRATHRGKRGQRVAKRFRVLLKQTFRATQGHRVDDQLLRDVVIRAYDCQLWGGIDYARSYCRRLVEVFAKDDPRQNFRITRAVVWNLAKVMLIKDEIYVAALCTSPEKVKRDRRRFGVNPAHGDRIVYRHFNVPEIDLFGHVIRLPAMKTHQWQHRLLSRARVLRPLLFPHRIEAQFRDWYEQLVDDLELAPDGDPRQYQRWLSVLSAPQTVKGFREVRYPKMEAARRHAEQWLKADLELFEAEAEADPAAADRTVNLPVVAAVQA